MCSLVWLEAVSKPAIAPPGANRLASKSAPVPTRPAAALSSAQVGGTITRRTNAPTRRPAADSYGSSAISAAGGRGDAAGGGGGVKTAPTISVSGVGGIKALRGQRANR
jgi:hypothetical protein